jgi:hypothetical protein
MFYDLGGRGVNGYGRVDLMCYVAGMAFIYTEATVRESETVPPM